MKAEQESFISRRLTRRGSTSRFTILQQCSAALSRTPFCLEPVSSLVRLGTIAGDGTIAAGIKFGSIHPSGTRLRRIGVHHFAPALGRLVSGAQIALAAIAPTGQACDQSDPVQAALEQVALNGPVLDVPSNQVRVVQNGPTRGAPSDQARVGPSGPAPDVLSDQARGSPSGPVPAVLSDQARVVPSDLQSVQNGQAMRGRSGPPLVGSDIIGHRRRIPDRRQGRNRERAIAKRTGRTSKHAHSSAHVRNSKERRGRKLNRHAAAVRKNEPARRERGLNREGIKNNAARRAFAIGV